MVKKGAAGHRSAIFFQMQPLSSTQKLPLAFRTGGGSCVGLRRTDGSKPPITAKIWRLTGAPNLFRAIDISQALEGAGCADVMAIQPPRGQKPWLIKAKPAKDSSEDFYGISTVEHTLLLSKVPPRAPYILGVQGLRTYRWKPYNSYHSQGAIEEAEEPLPSQMESGGSHGTAASSRTSTTG